MYVNVLHAVLDGVVGVPGISERLYALLGHGRWHDLLHAVIDASANSPSAVACGVDPAKVSPIDG